MTILTREEMLAGIRDAVIKANPEIECDHAAHGKQAHFCVERPIHLADILLAINNSEIEKARDISLEILNGYLVFWPKPSTARYNLRQDDLTLQSDETILFIYQLLK